MKIRVFLSVALAHIAILAFLGIQHTPVKALPIASTKQISVINLNPKAAAPRNDYLPPPAAIEPKIEPAAVVEQEPEPEISEKPPEPEAKPVVEQAVDEPVHEEAPEAPEPPPKPKAEKKKQPEPKTVVKSSEAKKAPAQTKPKKESTPPRPKEKSEPKKPSTPSAAEIAQRKAREEKLRRAQQSIANIDKKSDNSERKGSRPGQGRPSASNSPPPKLRIDSDSSENGSGEGGLEYRSEIAQHVKLLLRLPEYGEVKVKLTLDRKGRVVGLTVISAQNSKNRDYAVKELKAMTFPPFGSYFSGEEEHSFVLTLNNDI